MGTVRISMAMSDYDHVRDLAAGHVGVEGVDLVSLTLPLEEIFHRFVATREWDVSEMSLGYLCAMTAAGDCPFVAIPVFPSRTFRLSAIYVRSDAGIRRLADLRGRRIGVPQWSQTATIYLRGYLGDEAGVPLDSVEWVQAGVDQPGREDPAPVAPPGGVSLVVAREKTLSGMLRSGEIDAALSARPPQAFLAADGSTERLFPDYRSEEIAYFRRSGIFPIMHAAVIRRDTFEANRWLPGNLLAAFEEAKRRSVARLFEMTNSLIPLPWGPQAAADHGRDLLFAGGDYWPYGIEPNRRTLETFLRYCREQGIVRRPLGVEDLFPPEARHAIRV